MVRAEQLRQAFIRAAILGFVCRHSQRGNTYRLWAELDGAVQSCAPLLRGNNELDSPRQPQTNGVIFPQHRVRQAARPALLPKAHAAVYSTRALAQLHVRLYMQTAPCTENTTLLTRRQSAQKAICRCILLANLAACSCGHAMQMRADVIAPDHHQCQCTRHFRGAHC
jgi:hypothetical protein